MATFTVTTTDDKGKGSLCAAIAAAQNGDRIRFDTSLANKTIVLKTGQLEITQNVTIDGSQAPEITISGHKTSRVFEIGSGAISHSSPYPQRWVQEPGLWCRDRFPPRYQRMLTGTLKQNRKH